MIQTDDNAIVELFFERSEAAIEECAKKYEGCCFAAASRIVCDEDAKECVNDLWLRVWSSIPPEQT